jgi:Na+-transporting NADH:ubiquinone oxidoreductase subunit C
VPDVTKNTYTMGFLTAVTIVAALILSSAASGLKPRQEENKRFDKKTTVLNALGFTYDDQTPKDKISTDYDKYVDRIFVSPQGKVLTLDKLALAKYTFEKAAKSGDVHINEPADYSKLSEDLALELYIGKDDSGKIVQYGFPVIGKGLWSTLYGIVCLDSTDLSTVKGIAFFDNKETPGLGKEIETDWFQDRFKGKSFINEKGEISSIAVVKGGINPALINHQVDAVSGATITCNGVTSMLSKDFKLYNSYFKTLRKTAKGKK